jgi:ABC-2 type transport system ATP-binding protein
VLEVGLRDHGDADRTVTALSSVGHHAPARDGSVVEMTVDDGAQAAMSALRALDAEGIVPIRFTLREPSLDDVFLALTGRRADGGGDPEHAAASTSAGPTVGSGSGGKP